jgi:protein gp37
MKNSKISWCDHTFNSWIGCEKVSAGCANCYAAAQNKRFGWCRDADGQPDFTVRKRTSAAYWRQPLAWDKEAALSGVRPRVFCGSMCDWLDDAVPVKWLADLLRLIIDTPHLDWLLLTKRPDNFFPRLDAALDLLCVVYNNLHGVPVKVWLNNGVPLKNVWLGTTVENQEMADKRIPELLKIPAKVRFLSCEPLLGRMNLSKFHIVGGADGRLACCWRLSFKERLVVLFTGKIWHQVLTFKQPLQPQLLGVEKPRMMSK